MARFGWPAVLLIVMVFAAGCCTVPKAPPPAPARPLAETLPRDPSAAEPPVVFEMPASMCLAEAEGISFVLDLPIDVFYYEDIWFWQIRKSWYWSKTYMGMLYELTEEQVPEDMFRFGTTYRQELPDCREFTYDDWYRRIKAAK